MFNLTDIEQRELTFYDLIGYTDAIVARKFEGLQLGDPKVFNLENLSDKQLHDIEEVNKWAQLDKIDEDGRQAWMTKMLSGPI